MPEFPPESGNPNISRPELTLQAQLSAHQEVPAAALVLGARSTRPRTRAVGFIIAPCCAIVRRVNKAAGVLADQRTVIDEQTTEISAASFADSSEAGR